MVACSPRTLKLFSVSTTIHSINMKFFLSTVLAASVVVSSHAFSAVAPKNGAVAASGNIDRSMKGIDDAGTFDPTSGDSAALKRNNKDEVWVPQVRVAFRGSVLNIFWMFCR